MRGLLAEPYVQVRGAADPGTAEGVRHAQHGSVYVAIAVLHAVVRTRVIHRIALISVDQLAVRKTDIAKSIYTLT